MSTITVKVIRKFSGSYTYTLEDGKVISQSKPAADPETFRRVTRAAAVQAARVQAEKIVQAAAVPVPVTFPIQVNRESDGSIILTYEQVIAMAKKTEEEETARAKAAADRVQAAAAVMADPAADPFTAAAAVQALNAAAADRAVKILTGKDPATVQAADPVRDFKPSETDGIPGPRDRFHFITLTGPIYNGYRLPLPEDPGAKIYPVYFVVNQDGAIMQTFRDGSIPGDPVKGWYFRSAGIDGIDRAQESIDSDIKRLRSWQRKAYAKTTDIPESITLPARGTLGNFQARAVDLYRELKAYGKKVILKIADYYFPAAVLAEACKLAGSETAHCTIESKPFPEFENRNGDKRQTDRINWIPALVVKTGDAVYNLKTQAADELTGMNIITCYL